MSDHPDIDRLPLEIDGTAVRETIREIFTNWPENGEPDNISKAGCLALARSGYQVWNAWRNVFPTNSNLVPNIADFSKYDFSADLINFSEFDFGDNANFSLAKFPKNQSFTNARLGVNCLLLATSWGDSCSFDKATFGKGTHFHGAQFGINCSFFAAKFGEDIQFFGAYFGAGITFQKAQFAGYINFSASNWEQMKILIEWTDEQFEAIKKSAARLNVAPDVFQAIDFKGAQFLGQPASNSDGQVDFSGRKFLGKTDFSSLDHESPVRFCSVPKFHGCEFHQDTSFDRAVFPDPTGNEKAARAYRTLKLAFSEQQALRQEQRFFRLEMEEERIGHWLNFWRALKSFKPAIAIQEIWVWFLHKLYELPSKYGLSVVRPTLLLVVSWLLFAQIYGSYLDTGTSCLSSLTTCELKTDWLGFSWHQALPLTGLNKPDEVSIKKIPLILLTFHKAISLAALFLIGLALRNLFKLK